MPRNTSRRSRDRRYFAAVERQIAAVRRRPNWYTPAEEFLRLGDTVAMFIDDEHCVPHAERVLRDGPCADQDEVGA